MQVRRVRSTTRNNRRGAIILLAAALMVVIFAFLAFTVDVGFITLTKAHLKTCTDSCSLSAVQDLEDQFQPGSPMPPTTVVTNVRNTSAHVALQHRSGERKNAYVKKDRDVRVGQYFKDIYGNWQKVYDVAPYNFVEVTARRDQLSGGEETGDEKLPLFFAPAIGHGTADVSARSAAAMLVGVGFRKPPAGGGNVHILPITLDVDTWNAMLAGVGDDNFAWDDEAKTISSGSDGILEVNLYPTSDGSLPPGNRGTVDFGHQGNSTADISRQILHGLNENDLSYFGGEIRFDNVPLVLNGDTGLSAGIKDELNAIRGLPRAIPLFSQVSGPGNNANYTIVKFVGIRILEVKLTGNPNQKRVIVQPAPFVAPEVIEGGGEVEVDSIFTTARLIE